MVNFLSHFPEPCKRIKLVAAEDVRLKLSDIISFSYELQVRRIYDLP